MLRIGRNLYADQRFPGSKDVPPKTDKLHNDKQKEVPRPRCRSLTQSQGTARMAEGVFIDFIASYYSINFLIMLEVCKVDMFWSELWVWVADCTKGFSFSLKLVIFILVAGRY